LAKSFEKTIYDGILFDSVSEAEFYKKLQQAKIKGDIKEFDLSPEYILQEEFTNWRNGKESSIKHYPDYLVTLNDSNQIILDTKGGSQHETDAKLKRKIFQYQNKEVPYYYVSICPKFIGGLWVETSPNFDFMKKLRTKYDSLFPNVNKRLKIAPQLGIDKWSEYFEFHDVAGLFYVWDKTYTKKELEKMNKNK
jgi:hypothetical protein